MDKGVAFAIIIVAGLSLINTMSIAAPIVENDNYNEKISAAAYADWLVSPTQYGENIPPQGRSLFDYVFIRTQQDKAAYDIPFPFSALVSELQTYVQESDGIKRVLLPLGRSLQRTAAGLDFFTYPRAVIAVDGQPSAKGNELYLKDRLYIGYQEKTDVLEVISYNESAARFEFQLVKDYAPGKTPKVFYANRAVCLSCHQNGSPIFSRPLWSETNANILIKDKLVATGKNYYEFPLDIGIDVPNAIDNATDRANMFSAQQWLWQSGCGDNDLSIAVQCRKELLKRILQYRLSGDRFFDDSSDVYLNTVIKTVEKNWQAKWPRGVLIPNPDIPDREPAEISALLSGDAMDQETLLRNQSNVPYEFEPLKPRVALHYYKKPALDIVNEWIAGLADFISVSDIKRLDKLLSTKLVQRTQFQGRCAIKENDKENGVKRISFNCREKNDSKKTIRELAGRVYLKNSRIIKGSIDTLELSSGVRLNQLSLEQSDHTATATVNAAPRYHSLRARGRDGNTIDSIQIFANGDVKIELKNDFALIESALERISLDAKPFRRAVIMEEIEKALAESKLTRCCLQAISDPPPQVETDNRVLSNTGDSTQQMFQHYCGLCHNTPDHAPPNFLHGDEIQIKQNLKQCAPRLYVRLSMWNAKEQLSVKTPMPPVHALGALGIKEQDWVSGDALKTLRDYVRQLAGSDTGSAINLESLVRGGYENLPRCIH